MRIVLISALLLAGPLAAPLALQPVVAAEEAPAISTAELMRVTALDVIFDQFAASIEAAPGQQAMPLNAALDAIWAETAREVFAADRMHAALEASLDDKLRPEDYEALADFFSSPFGREVTEVERAVTLLPPDAQEAARESGLALASEGSERRHAQIEEMLKLVSADISIGIVRESVRGMLIGMSVNAQQGEIVIPWEEIDLQLEAIMPAIEADIAATQRALMFFAYRDFSAQDLDTYLEFLRTDAARGFYAVAVYAIGDIVTTRMEAFGEALAAKLDRVSV